jgi:L-ascorbate metabolism protein UlaG (beta-lactamase superfamily)
MKENINIHYLYNSGFTVETENYLLIFDYYIDSVENGEKCISNGAIGFTDLKINKKILVFVSHKHQDHFNPVIFEWSRVSPDIEYILSNDIKKRIECSDSSSSSSSNSNGNGNGNININGAIHKMQAYKELELSAVHIRTFGSTDVGVSFLVTVDGARIFHAGDLNWWYWNDSTDQENKQATGMFKAEIEKIKRHICSNSNVDVNANANTSGCEFTIDIAFFPVDKRLKEAYCMGAEYFIEKIKPSVLIPMHFGDAFDATSDFAQRMKAASSSTMVVEIDHRGQEFKMLK